MSKMDIRIRDANQETTNDKDILLYWEEDPRLIIDTGNERFETIYLETEGDKLILITPSGTIKIDTKKMLSGWDKEKGKNTTDWLEIPKESDE